MEYKVPSSIKLSEDCKSLLSRILVADPTKRITIDGIFHHPWWVAGLRGGDVDGSRSVKLLQNICFAKHLCCQVFC